MQGCHTHIYQGKRPSRLAGIPRKWMVALVRYRADCQTRPLARPVVLWALAQAHVPCVCLQRQERVGCDVSLPVGCTYHGPVIFAAADIEHESGDDFFPPRRLRHLGVELDAVQGLRVMRDRSERCRFCVRDDVEPRRRRRELVPMRHPHLCAELSGWCRRRRATQGPSRTSISSPSPSNNVSTVGEEPPVANLLICTRAEPYSRRSHFVTLPPKFHAISCVTTIYQPRLPD